MMSAAEHVEQLRCLAASHGIPLECVDRLALSPRNAGKALDVSEKTIRALIDAGALSVVRIGRCVRVPAVDLIGYLEEHRLVRSPRESTENRTRAERFLDDD